MPAEKVLAPLSVEDRLSGIEDSVAWLDCRVDNLESFPVQETSDTLQTPIIIIAFLIGAVVSNMVSEWIARVDHKRKNKGETK